jgi:hypothetical protein
VAPHLAVGSWLVTTLYVVALRSAPGTHPATSAEPAREAVAA